ncbi:DUF2076 domain-containing protein [Chromobacterium sphagni]|uniref:ABC transporter substrate-binding protein n=1 Tax=Chromobacterium sphagni TaxID=1903179 RepID=A0A1S1X449_9NEIS|nr:DUF2076 domain-containing protein [Chromobacterium sphagni]OHX14006.1 hypothetical protein BI347_11180 [Chromobacterium sphagni]OHX20213.1 hypothetical protein BI344_06870 [Chromobacterium sphagni]
MSPQETQALQNFLNQLVQTRGVAKDPQANAAITQAVAAQPDAAYLLVLRCMQQEQALNAAKAQIAQVQNDLQAARSAPPATAGAPGTFLDPSPGAAWSGAPAAPRPAAPAPAYQQPAPAYPPAAPAYQQPAPAYQPPAPAQRSGFLSGGVGSFLGNVATTAAGVAAGTFLVQGIESLFGGNEHSGHSGGGGFDHGSSQGFAEHEAPVEQYITVNNYYESDSAGGYQQASQSQDDYPSVSDTSDDTADDNSDYV